MRHHPIGSVHHAATPVGPETWHHRGDQGSILVAAHTLACDPDRFLGILDVLSEPFDPTLEVDYCPDCMRIAGPIAERRQRHERLRAEGKPIGLAELLDQGVWWRSSDGEWLTISFMERSHAHNAAEWLRRRSLPLAFRYELARMPDPFADDGILHAIAMEDERRMGDPQGWLESTACYRALANRGAGR